MKYIYVLFSHKKDTPDVSRLSSRIKVLYFTSSSLARATGTEEKSRYQSLVNV